MDNYMQIAWQRDASPIRLDAACYLAVQGIWVLGVLHQGVPWDSLSVFGRVARTRGTLPTPTENSVDKSLVTRKAPVPRSTAQKPRPECWSIGGKGNMCPFQIRKSHLQSARYFSWSWEYSSVDRVIVAQKLGSWDRRIRNPSLTK